MRINCIVTHRNWRLYVTLIREICMSSSNHLAPKRSLTLDSFAETLNVDFKVNLDFLLVCETFYMIVLVSIKSKLIQ